ncbi:DUF2946 family protein [Acinetobacter pollinis]
MMFLFKSGLALSLGAIILQLAVFLQPFLPQQYQVALVCEQITTALASNSPSEEHHHMHNMKSMQMSEHPQTMHHDAAHQCPFCTVYNHIIPFIDLGIDEVFERLNIRLLAFAQAFQHIYFVLQRLFLIPQGRAPPSIA